MIGPSYRLFANCVRSEPARRRCNSKKLLFGSAAFLVAGILSDASYGQPAPVSLWTVQFGVRMSDAARVAVSDPTGVFVAGGTSGSLGGLNLGLTDVFVARIDLEGNRIWTHQFGTAGHDFVRAGAVDGAGGVFIGGYWPDNAWASRFDAAGNRLWLKEPLSHLPGAHINTMASDREGGVFVGGRTYVADVVVARLGSSGASIWTRVFASTGTAAAYVMTEDGQGGVYVGGATSGSLGPPFTGFQDAWLSRYDSDGERLWLRQWGDPVGGAVDVSSMAPDGENGVYVAGLIGGPHSYTRYIARHEPDGERMWTRFITGFAIAINGLAPDSDGGVYVTGSIAGTVGAPNPEGSDVLLGRYDADGNLVWLIEFGSSRPDMGYAVASDHAGGVYTVGSTQGNISGQVPPPPSNWGVFVARYRGDNVICYANCDESTVAPVLNIEDFMCFMNEFAVAMGLPHEQQIGAYANCNQSTTAPVLNVEDFTCFINAFAAGCP